MAVGVKLPEGFELRQDLASRTTAGDVKAMPRHRWFHFLHSYSPSLVETVLDHWSLDKGILVDNFVGSGTTVLVGRQRGLTTFGFDLSPLSVLISQAKAADYDANQIERALHRLLRNSAPGNDLLQGSWRLKKAFSENEQHEISALLNPIRWMRGRPKRLFLLGLIWSVKPFSRAVADGGWFRWKEWPDRSQDVRPAFVSTIESMIADIRSNALYGPSATVEVADARRLPLVDGSADGIITSPPYANRHDYSRVFHIELLLQGMSEGAITQLRKCSMRSHVEAQPPKGSCLVGYSEPDLLRSALDTLPGEADERIKPMLQGYSEDIFITLTEAFRILRPGGKAALVVGNVRHAGVMIPIDEIVGTLAEQVGFQVESTWVARMRGNSAQQMGEFGREASRESVVLLSKVHDD
jgi:DNA modification methylase